ncbi:2TM domain-containing protein [Aquabacterium sp. J223]|uniref:2TM domain-containing protein n=1 Tax=Aquabacterium sp. J223 TaxID=2898431 RepID=UPI0021ADDF56|nr:2TM domain-containing protein [Aquabacterium sp. J223]UUX94706.1 2TM domain-containing protein [Aquabacterium sp. J223]
MSPASDLAHVDPALLARARRRLGLKKGLAVHATVYLLVNAGLQLIDALTGGRHWAVFPLAGWGLGLGVHAAVTWLALQTDGRQDDWLQAEVARLRRRDAAR